MTLRFGTVASDLDLATQGKRAGHFGLAHSDDRFAFSTIQSPLAVIRGGAGPTALVCAGNHGDEYEGQIIVRRLYEQLEPGDLAGGLILLEGRGTMEIDGEVREVGPGDAILIPAGAWHQITATERLRFLCCCAPPYRHEDTYFEE